MKMKLLPAFVIALSLIISVEAFFSFNILNEIENSPKGAHAGGLAGFIGGITAGFFVGGPLGAAAGGFVGMCAGAISGNLAGGLTKHAGYSEEWEVVNAIFVGGPIGAFAGWGVANEVVSRNFVALAKKAIEDKTIDVTPAALAGMFSKAAVNPKYLPEVLKCAKNSNVGSCLRRMAQAA